MSFNTLQTGSAPARAEAAVTSTALETPMRVDWNNDDGSSDEQCKSSSAILFQQRSRRFINNGATTINTNQQAPENVIFPPFTLYRRPVLDQYPRISYSTTSSTLRTSPTLLQHGYELGETLGSGSYSKVKVAYSNQHQRKVAVKIVSKSGASEKYLTKFLPREMEIIKIISHKNIIPFLQCMESTKRFYVIMELAINGDLLTMIEKSKFISELQSKLWFVQLLEGIEHCHSIGVVHRDLKCENILLDDLFCVRISDFGFARFAIGRHFLSDTYCGSHAYAAPEILKGIPYEPQRADIWSLGVVLFAMVFGKLPFDDSNVKTLLRLVLSNVIFPSTPTVSSECKDVLRAILVESWNRPSIEKIRQLPWIKH